MGVEVDFFRDDNSRISNGVGGPAKVSPTGAVLISPEDAYESTRLGKRYYLNNTALTIDANNNNTLAATSTPIVGIINPVGSGYCARIMSGWLASISGTPPAQAGPSWHFATAIQAISTNPAGTIVNGLIGSNDVGAMRAYNDVALTGLGVATGQVGMLYPFGGIVFAGAIAANHDAGWKDETNGGIVVPPGAGLFMLAGAAAGTSWVVSAGMSWIEEVWPA